VPIFVTENGVALDDRLSDSGTVDDGERIAYLRSHLEVLSGAIADGIDVRGYFVWSLWDNFEWEFGYDLRFGLVYVDYETQARIPKASYHWYRNLIRTINRRPGVSHNPLGS
jgi:beta-glucosidase